MTGLRGAGDERARLFTIKQKERGLTEQLLAALGAVPELTVHLLRPLDPCGKGRARLSTWDEFAFEPRFKPDGQIRFEYGDQVDDFLVEVKTGDNDFTAKDVERHAELLRDGRERTLRGLITVSNRIARGDGAYPDPHVHDLLDGAPYLHVSWCEIHTAIQRLLPDVDGSAARLLEDFACLLDDRRSGSQKMASMPTAWSRAIEDVRARRAGTSGEIEDAVVRWHEMLGFVALATTRTLAGQGDRDTSVHSHVPTSYRRDVRRHVEDDVATLRRDAHLVGGLTIKRGKRSRRITVRLDVGSDLLELSFRERMDGRSREDWSTSLSGWVDRLGDQLMVEGSASVDRRKATAVASEPSQLRRDSTLVTSTPLRTKSTSRTMIVDRLQKTVEPQLLVVANEL